MCLIGVYRVSGVCVRACAHAREGAWVRVSMIECMRLCAYVCGGVRACDPCARTSHTHKSVAFTCGTPGLRKKPPIPHSSLLLRLPTKDTLLLPHAALAGREPCPELPSPSLCWAHMGTYSLRSPPEERGEQRAGQREPVRQTARPTDTYMKAMVGTMDTSLFLHTHRAAKFFPISSLLQSCNHTTHA